MKTDIILAGVGGQGILSIASCIGVAAMNENLYVKQSELHGMSQRGGAVQSHFRLSDKPIYSDLCVICAMFIGLTVSAEEIIRDLKILNRERFLNLSWTSYINSKIAVLFGISAIQTLSHKEFYSVESGGADDGVTSDSYCCCLSESCFCNLVNGFVS